MTTLAATAPRHPFRLTVPAASRAKARATSVNDTVKDFLVNYCACFVAASAFIV